MMVMMVKISNKTEYPRKNSKNSYKQIPPFLRNPYILYIVYYKL